MDAVQGRRSAARPTRRNAAFRPVPGSHFFPSVLHAIVLRSTWSSCLGAETFLSLDAADTSSKQHDGERLKTV